MVLVELKKSRKGREKKKKKGKEGKEEKVKEPALLTQQYKDYPNV